MKGIGVLKNLVRAEKWLRAHDLAFVEHPIRETPPPLAELRVMLAARGGEEAD